MLALTEGPFKLLAAWIPSQRKPPWQFVVRHTMKNWLAGDRRSRRLMLGIYTDPSSLSAELDDILRESCMKNGHRVLHYLIFQLDGSPMLSCYCKNMNFAPIRQLWLVSSADLHHSPDTHHPEDTLRMRHCLQACSYLLCISPRKKNRFWALLRSRYKSFWSIYIKGFHVRHLEKSSDFPRFSLHRDAEHSLPIWHLAFYRQTTDIQAIYRL